MENSLTKLYNWIDKLIEENPGALIIKEMNFPRLPDYYSEETLGAAKAVLLPNVPFPPLSDMGITGFEAFESGGNLIGITFKDRYFIKESYKLDESLHFHEIIHLLQWKHIGFDKFLIVYGLELLEFGYHDSPLEKMAYSMQKRFDSGEIFNAEEEVLSKIENQIIPFMKEFNL